MGIIWSPTASHVLIGVPRVFQTWRYRAFWKHNETVGRFFFADRKRNPTMLLPTQKSTDFEEWSSCINPGWRNKFWFVYFGVPTPPPPKNIHTFGRRDLILKQDTRDFSSYPLWVMKKSGWCFKFDDCFPFHKTGLPFVLQLGSPSCGQILKDSRDCSKNDGFVEWFVSQKSCRASGELRWMSFFRWEWR